MTMPNGVAVLHVLALHVKPRKDSASNLQVLSCERCKSLKRSPDHARSKKPPNKITSFMDACAWRTLRSHLIKIKRGYGRLSFLSIGILLLLKRCNQRTKNWTNDCTPNCLQHHFNALMVMENLGPDPSERLANEPQTSRSAS